MYRSWDADVSHYTSLHRAISNSNNNKKQQNKAHAGRSIYRFQQKPLSQAWVCSRYRHDLYSLSGLTPTKASYKFTHLAYIAYFALLYFITGSSISLFHLHYSSQLIDTWRLSGWFLTIIWRIGASRSLDITCGLFHYQWRDLPWWIIHERLCVGILRYYAPHYWMYLQAAHRYFSREPFYGYRWTMGATTISYWASLLKLFMILCLSCSYASPTASIDVGYWYEVAFLRPYHPSSYIFDLFL